MLLIWQKTKLTKKTPQLVGIKFDTWKVCPIIFQVWTENLDTWLQQTDH